MHSHDLNRVWLRRLNSSVAALALVALSATGASAQYRGRGTGLTVFDNPDYGGRSATFRTEITDMRDYGLNDRITSLRIDNGQAWEVCQDINFGGRCRVFSASVPDLREAGWNDRISSARPVGFANGNNGRRGNNSNNGWGWGNGNSNGNNDRNNDRPRLVFFDRTNYRGSSRDITSTSNLGGFANSARSVEVYGGMWELCDGRSRNSICLTVRESVPDLRRLGFTNGVTSAREINDRRRF